MTDQLKLEDEIKEMKLAAGDPIEIGYWDYTGQSSEVLARHITNQCLGMESKLPRVNHTTIGYFIGVEHYGEKNTPFLVYGSKKECASRKLPLYDYLIINRVIDIRRLS